MYAKQLWVMEWTEGYTYVYIEWLSAYNLLLAGNSGYETATNLVGAAAFIHLGSRHRMKQAHQTHYVGDLRAINNQLVDTYQLKSLDAFMSMPCHSALSVRNKMQI